MSREKHWEAVYRDKTAEEVSWFQPSPELSLALIEAAGMSRQVPIIDVGGGASRLVDRLIEAGYGDVSVLDISSAALEQSRARLGVAADAVRWLQADITRAELPIRYRLWHDRAVFHFLVDAQARAAYLERLERHLEPGGQAIIATFSPDGPERCSGLPVQRYSAQSLAQALGERFRLIESRDELHTTPAGARQTFVYCRFEHATNTDE
ncbi:MAG: class I SAM-dependent methyltransferase [Acidihalobacter sp.]|jgi:ubiquinone/menaquinone biosynthesis C-methylase UbiE